MLEYFGFSVRRLLLSVFALVLGAIPIGAAWVGARWNSLPLFALDNVLSSAEIAALVAFAFLIIAVCSGYLIDWLGHAIDYREHGHAILDIMLFVFFLIISVIAFLAAIFVGFLFNEELEAANAAEDVRKYFDESVAYADLTTLGFLTVALAVVADLWLARRIWKERQRISHIRGSL